MAKLDQNGLPVLVTAESTESGQTIGATIIATTTPQKTFGALASELLDQFSAEAVIVIDPNTRKVTAASAAAGIALAAAVAGVANTQTGDLTPDAGQTGKSLTYTSDIADLTDEVQAAVSAAVDSAKPKRTIQSLVSALLGADEVGELAVKPVLVVNQNTGEVRVYDSSGAANIGKAIDALANAGDRVQIELTEVTAEGEPEPLVFEGGATS